MTALQFTTKRSSQNALFIKIHSTMCIAQIQRRALPQSQPFSSDHFSIFIWFAAEKAFLWTFLHHKLYEDGYKRLLEKGFEVRNARHCIWSITPQQFTTTISNYHSLMSKVLSNLNHMSIGKWQLENSWDVGCETGLSTNKYSGMLRLE